MKKIISTLLVMCMLLSMVTVVHGQQANAAAAPSFRDVKPSDWYYDSVNYVLENGLMVGTEAGKFSPKMTFSRAMIVTVLWTMEGEPVISGSDFTDVPANSWFSTAVAWAAQNEIVSGYGNGKFGPNDPITREQLVSIFKNYSEFTGINTQNRTELSRYSDANKVSSWAKDAISWAVAERLISGTSATTLSPKGQATRAEAAAMLEGYCPTLPDAESEPGLSRGEWIQMLAEKMNIPLAELTGETAYYFADIRGHRYAAAIEAAQKFGLLPPAEVEDLEQDVPFFKPDSPATREFAAFVATKALGYDGTHSFDTSSWSDLAQIKYKNEAAIAVSYGFLKLQDGAFRPKDKFTSSDADKVFATIDRIKSSEIITPDQYKDEAVFTEDVIKDDIDDLTGYTVTDNGNGTYTVVMPKTSEVENGSKIILPANDEYPSGIAFIVQSYKTNGNKLTLTCTLPELADIFKEIEFIGKGTPIVDKVVAAEGVHAEYDPNGSIDSQDTGAYSLDINTGTSTSVPGTLVFEMPDKKLSENVSVNGSVEIKVPDISAKVDAYVGIFGFKLHEFLLSITEEIEFKAELEYKLMESGYEITDILGNTSFEGGRIELGRIPIMIGSCLSFDIVVFFNTEAKGTASITYTIVSTQGYQYKNGTSRAIFDFDDSLDALELKGSFKAGLGVSGVLCAFGFIDIVGYYVEAGVAINASMTVHTIATDTLVCGDATLYAYCESGIDPETLVGMFLKDVCHYELKFEHLDNDENNPFKLKFHIENFRIVPECTFGRGTISGFVAALDTGSPLENARIKIYSGTDDDTSLIRTMYTDSQGKYNVDNLTDGQYTVTVSATGYYTYEVEITVTNNETTYIENLLMIDRDGNGALMQVEGQITDAVTGYGVENTYYKLRKGWNNKTGEVIAQGEFADAYYTVEAAIGNYTLEISKDGYITNYTNIAISENAQAGNNITISPENISVNGDNLRIVLTWGETPRDLDSHLRAPDPYYSNSRYHIYFGDGYYYSEGELIADLDVDDTTSYGPETVTVSKLANSGIYNYYVHDYTNRNSSYSESLSYSSAKVQVYSGSVCIATFNVPAGNTGTVWHVFDYDPVQDKIIPVNTFDNESSAGYVGE